MFTCKEGVKIGSGILIAWLIIAHLRFPQEFFIYIDASTGERLQNVGLCSAPRAFRLLDGRDFIVPHLLLLRYDHQFFLSHPKDQVMDPPPFKNSWIRLCLLCMIIIAHNVRMFKVNVTAKLDRYIYDKPPSTHVLCNGWRRNALLFTFHSSMCWWTLLLSRSFCP
jgi:hypothetical protein